MTTPSPMTTPMPSGVTASRRPVQTSQVRIEIQALRAVAVMGVLLYHLWPGRLPGGFVGVDVFFVVSGFLITDHLLREHSRTGSISLPKFWARRARRLLPASLLVLIATAVAVWIWVPDTRWGQFGSDIVASALYVENWALAAQSIDYMALSNVKSPVQHFWTLSVEEQFYLVWPLILITAYAVTRAARSQLRAVTLIIATVTAASLVYSVFLTATSPSVAYFSTFTRGWEFGLGALLSIFITRRPMSLAPAWAALTSWLGIVMVGASMLYFTGETPVPSATVFIPTMGAVLVIVAGAPRNRFAPTRLFALAPVQFVGDVSYGAYLWHWPLIVLLPYILGGPLGTAVSILILVASLALGWVSKRFIEDPIRTRSWFTGARPRWTFLATAVAMMLVAGASLPLATFRVEAPQPPPDLSATDCYGAMAMSDPTCPPADEIPLLSPLSSYAVDLPPEEIRACERATTAGEFVRCDFGPMPASGMNVALIGDSHGTRIVEPLAEAVNSMGGTLSTFLVSGCSVMSQEVTGSAWGFDPVYAEQCREQTVGMFRAVTSDPNIDAVVLTNRTRLYVTDQESNRPLTPAAVEESIRLLEQAGKRVIVLKDPPEMNAIPPQGGGSAPDCLSRAAKPADCGLLRDLAEFADPMITAANATAAGVVDLDDLFCNAERCLPQIGGLVVYSDDNHMTRSFALSLTEPLTERLRPLLRGITPTD